MTISVLVLFYLLLLHYIADFLAQSDYWAKNKSKSNDILFRHCATYSFILSVGVLALGLNLINVGVFMAITFATHFVIDYITSRQTSKLFGAKNYHWGFAVIGIDQFAHMAQLVLTYVLVIGNETNPF